MVVVVSPDVQSPIFVFADEKAWRNSPQWKQCVEKYDANEVLHIESPSEESSDKIKTAKVAVLSSTEKNLSAWADAGLADALAACQAAGGIIATVGPVSSILGSVYIKGKSVADGWDLIRLAVLAICNSEEDWSRAEEVVAHLHKNGLEEAKGFGVFDAGGAIFFPCGDGCRVEAIGKSVLEVSSIPKAGSFGKVLRLRKIQVPDPQINGHIGSEPAERWTKTLELCAKWLLDANGTAVVSTGAGISAESGIPTYRDPGGLWEIYDQMEVSHIKGFARDPLKCWRFELELTQLLKNCGPNPGHIALRDMEKAGVVKTVVTQNVDGLHLAAGSLDVLEIHGSETRGICMNATCRTKLPYMNVFRNLGWVDESGATTSLAPPLPKQKRQQTRGGVYAELTSSSGSSSSSSSSPASSSGDESTGSASSKASKGPIKFKTLREKLRAKTSDPSDIERMDAGPKCEACKEGFLKPDAVYFKEPLPKAIIKRAVKLSKAARVFIIVGTSGQVAPACKLPILAKNHGAARIIEVGPRETDNTKSADILLLGSAAVILPALAKA
eukprot:CAMPEP_0169395396 /NCGR_PEP_ID=MMETSP1017-20121227/50613_1 /TAXON_ID=342587 /ORGANISM="Karlodinium micrum, Strain CCMP2283" /LENGTH=555 /DNA_ID=CAMNT_0009499367 /DNA_START=38 /DNA_END=1701 /DNA_ORIENTATION=-